LTLIIPSLGCGGAERVMTIMANYWARRRWEITLLTLCDRSTRPFYELDAGVRYEALGLMNDSGGILEAARNNIKRIYTLRRAVRRSNPDAVISFLDTTNVLTLLATRGLGIPVIVSERIDPASNAIGKAWKHLRNRAYPMADLLVVQSGAALDYFSQAVRSRARIIPNPVLPPRQDGVHCDLKANGPLVVAMGRLEEQKGFDLLLKAFAKLRDGHPKWRLMILGEGPLRHELEGLSRELGLAGRVDMPGRVKDPHRILKQADLFVLPSRFEGFPNALCEAMACGLPAISSDCPTGPRDIIRDKLDGLLVPNENVNALALAMDRLMGNEMIRKQYAFHAPQVINRFGLESVMQMWEEAVGEVAGL
jgi:GalNAc-alpha-(1->4)-GalNAc-alpha-(1->3)-diNAcBac-PP-undecaprenol alpha-1,4-N-acetyl-D-galactosaminyltransferase